VKGGNRKPETKVNASRVIPPMEKTHRTEKPRPPRNPSYRPNLSMAAPDVLSERRGSGEDQKEETKWERELAWLQKTLLTPPTNGPECEFQRSIDAEVQE